VSGIGVVVALPREIPAGFLNLSYRRRVATHPYPIYRSETMPHVIVQAGMGRTRAAAAARVLVRCCSPVGLVSFGFAGGLAPGLARGTIVIGTEVVCEDRVGQWPMADGDLVEQFHAAAVAEELPTQQGKLVTSHHIVADSAAKADLWEKSGACAVDMETLGIVEAADEASLPWVAVRAIVDSASDTLPSACLRTLRANGQVAMGRLLWMICRSPPMLRHLVRLADNTALARRHLSHVFERWAKSRVVPGPQTLRISLL